MLLDFLSWNPSFLLVREEDMDYRIGLYETI